MPCRSDSLPSARPPQSFPPNFPTDNEFFEEALREYNRANGTTLAYANLTKLGRSQVFHGAQRLKEAAKRKLAGIPDPEFRFIDWILDLLLGGRWS
jgi:hypothetical protein